MATATRDGNLRECGESLGPTRRPARVWVRHYAPLFEPNVSTCRPKVRDVECADRSADRSRRGTTNLRKPH